MPREPEARPLVEPTKPFNLVLAQIEGGVLHDDLSDEVREMNTRLSEYAASNGSAKGSITVRLNFKLEKGGVLELHADIVTKTPKYKREKTVLWLTPGNNVTDENPKQAQMFPRRAPAADAAPRAIEEAPAAARKV